MGHDAMLNAITGSFNHIGCDWPCTAPPNLCLIHVQQKYFFLFLVQNLIYCNLTIIKAEFQSKTNNDEQAIFCVMWVGWTDNNMPNTNS